MRPIHDHEQSDGGRIAANPRVSVLIITYNQADYIATALQSAVNQRAEFPFEIVVGEDCSTDSTRAVCLDFQRRHPDRIRLLWSSGNLGFQHNLTRTLNSCRGEFVAILEGDDFWIDGRKLERQVQALERYAQVKVCVTRGNRLLPDGTRVTMWERGEAERVISIAELAAGEEMMAPTASILARREALQALPAWLEQAPVRDSFLLLGLAASTGALYLPAETCVYRMATAGSWSQSYDEQNDRVRIDYARRMLKAFGQAMDSFDIDPAILRRRLSSFHLLLARAALRDGRMAEAIRHCLQLDPRYAVDRIWHRISRK